MKHKKTRILTTIVCLIPIAAGIILYNQLPEQIVTHWDAMGNPNGWSSRFTGVVLFPGLLLVLNLLFPFILKTDPKYHSISEKIQGLIQWTIPAVSLFASGITLAEGLGFHTPIPVLGSIFLGLMFIVIGNYLPKVSQSYTVGIKIPWTLADEENWDKTHRMAGYLWVICGCLMVLLAFTPIGPYAALTLSLIMIIVPMVYSYLLWKKKTKLS